MLNVIIKHDWTRIDVNLRVLSDSSARICSSDFAPRSKFLIQNLQLENELSSYFLWRKSTPNFAERTASIFYQLWGDERVRIIDGEKRTGRGSIEEVNTIKLIFEATFSRSNIRDSPQAAAKVAV